MSSPVAAGNCPRPARLGEVAGDGTGSGGGGPGGSEVPAPPSLGEAVATCPSPPAPTIGRNPDPEGVTGMETYLWAAHQEALASAAEVRGYPVACTVAPLSWTWRTGDGATYTRDRPGGPHPDNPAEHVYETKGSYEMSVTVVWRATTTSGSADLTRTTTAPYHVFEIRSVLTR